MKAATALTKKYLAQQHRLANKVEETPPQYHADTNRVDVAFKGGTLAPMVVVRTTGARSFCDSIYVGAGNEEAYSNLLRGYCGFRPGAGKASEISTDYFQNKGFYDAKGDHGFAAAARSHFTRI